MLDQALSQDRQRSEAPQILSKQEYVEETTVANPGLCAVVAEDPILGLSTFGLMQRTHARELILVEVIQASLDHIAAISENIYAFLHAGAEETPAAVRKVDESLGADREPASAPAGVPLALKDVFTTTDTPTTCTSRMLEDYMSPYDATVAVKSRVADIPIPGKTNMDKLVTDSSTGNSTYGPTYNP